jgi:hypothetical protein
MGSKDLGDKKSLAETNMTHAGCLPYPKNFEIHAFSFVFDRTADKTDIDLFKEYAYFSFNIGSKNYLTLPLSVICNYMERYRDYVLAEPLDLIPQGAFEGSLVYSGDVEIQKPFRLRCVLNGFFKREVH